MTARRRPWGREPRRASEEEEEEDRSCGAQCAPGLLAAAEARFSEPALFKALSCLNQLSLFPV